jgi:hypothetical protein
MIRRELSWSAAQELGFSDIAIPTKLLYFAIDATLRHGLAGMKRLSGRLRIHLGVPREYQGRIRSIRELVRACFERRIRN